jgi:hypothetical protein
MIRQEGGMPSEAGEGYPLFFIVFFFVVLFFREVPVLSDLFAAFLVLFLLIQVV